MEVNEKNCKECPIFEDGYKENMIKNNICHKREMVGCPREKNGK